MRPDEGGRGSEGSVEMIILALDVGAARIGVAEGDPTGLLATPRGVIRRRSTTSAVAAVARAVAEAGAGLVVVGLPISLDGTLNAQARAVQGFAERLRRALPVPVVYWDERLSTVAAEEALRAAGVRPDRIRERVDAAAAAIILQGYLDERRRTGPDAVPGAPPDVARSEAPADGRPDDG
jgi:putative Holliday junction resolvase